MSNIYPGGDAQYSTNLGLSLWGADEVVVENFLLIDAAVGAGSSVKVNGSTVTNPNFNGILPAAPGGNTNITFQVSGSNVSAYVPTGVTSITGDSVVYNNTASTGAVTLSLISQAANTVFAGPTTGVNAAPTFRALVAADIPSGTVLWSSLGNAAANLSLSNAGFTTTFNQTSAAAWLWYNTTVGTSGSTNSSPIIELSANYYTGSLSAQDTWSISSSLAAGTNGASTLTFAHSGSTGAAGVIFPNGTTTVKPFGFSTHNGGFYYGVNSAGMIVGGDSGDIISFEV